MTVIENIEVRGKTIRLAADLAGTGRRKTVSKPLAQYAIPCNDQTRQGVVMESIRMAKESIRKETEHGYYILVLLEANGCRISEIVGLSSGDYLGNGKLMIRGKKGSKTRIGQAGEVSGYLDHCRNIGKRPFADYNRFWVYRLFRRHGIGFKFYGDRKSQVTHIFRTLHIKQVEAATDLETAKDAVGHKSIKSTEHYAKK